ncbi:MAG TPA: M1 family metallopeptidase [Ignavibacteriales bacterium]|nr:M1 family metallopeptidase [Ignavibacteriales bacterium]HPD67248.1 M1 family metallopeptidase [Ignavibacteriales bacterium]HRR17759.1 M1 family metallopeptidase [Ignavibacteriales bacterium]HRT98553.1 M1 family metallopeptidase [Ignavibacteriales bacterium]
MKNFINLKVAIYFLILLFLQIAFIKFKTTHISPQKAIKYQLFNTTNIIDLIKSDYHISLSLYNKNIIVDANFTVDIKSPVDTLKLNLYNNLKINCIKVNSNLINFKHFNDIVYVPLNYFKGIANITLQYNGKPRNEGISSFKVVKKDNYYTLNTINEPFYAPTWLACFDNNIDKFNLYMTIEVDTPYIAVSNGKLVSQHTHNGKNIFQWKTYHPIVPYLVSIYAAKYYVFADSVKLLNGTYLPLIYYSYKNNEKLARKFLEDHKGYFHLFENLFGPYPFYKEKYAFADINWNGGAIENQTISGIGEIFMSDTRQAQEMLIHELSHQWWGNSVTIDNWNDIWLNEGLARYSEALAVEYFSSIQDYKNFMKDMIFPFYGRLASPGDNLFSLLVYDKGAWIFHMLRQSLGDEMFFDFLKSYYNQFKYQTVNTKQFKAFLENFTSKNFDRFFDDWIYKCKYIPHISYTYNISQIEKQKYRVEIKLQQYNPQNYVFELPLEIQFSNANNKEIKNFIFNQKNSIFVTEINFYPKKITIDPNNKLLLIVK